MAVEDNWMIDPWEVDTSQLDEGNELMVFLHRGFWRELVAPGAEALLVPLIEANPERWAFVWTCALHALREDTQVGITDMSIAFANRWVDVLQDKPAAARVDHEWTVACVDAHSGDVSEFRRALVIFERLAPWR